MNEEHLKTLTLEELFNLSETNIVDFRYGPSDIFKVAYEKYMAAGNDDMAEKMRKEILIFDLSKHSVADQRFREKFSGTISDTGEEWKYPDIKNDFQEDTIEYYKQRCNETSNIVFKARYADFIWEIEKKKAFPYVINAIEAYLECTEVYLALNWGKEVFDSVSRALQLALLISNNHLIDRSINKAHSLLEQMRKQGEYISILAIVNFLIDSEKRLSEKLDLKNYLQILEEGVSYFQQQVDFYDSQRNFIEAIVHINKIQKDNEIIIETNLLRIADSFIEEAVWKKEHYPNGNIVASHFYEEAMIRYMELGKYPHKVEWLKLQISEANKAATEKEFRFVTSEVSIQKELIDQYLELYDREDLRECLMILTSDQQFLSNWSSAIQTAEHHAVEFALQNLAQLSVMKGNITVKKITDPSEKIEYNAVQNFIRHYQLASIMVFPHIFDILLVKSGFSEKIKEHFSESENFNEERIEIILNGIERYKAGDYISSIHILVFQVEGLLRNFIEKFGLPTFVYRNSEMRERMLPDLIDTLGKVQGFDPNFLKFINIFLNDIRGENLRNDIAHGIVSNKVFKRSNAELLIYLLLKLANYRFKIQQNMQDETE